jgi:hypothetical protein
MSHVHRLILAAGGLALLALSACAGSGREAGPLIASQTPYERDIPLPAGFRLIDRSSEDWASASLRYLRHRYRGQADKYAVREFYRTQMPLVRWSQVSDNNVHGRYTMRFVRGTESCVVTIHDGGALAAHRAVVEVIITPLQ